MLLLLLLLRLKDDRSRLIRAKRWTRNGSPPHTHPVHHDSPLPPLGIAPTYTSAPPRGPGGPQRPPECVSSDPVPAKARPQPLRAGLKPNSRPRRALCPSRAPALRWSSRPTAQGTRKSREGASFRTAVAYDLDLDARFDPLDDLGLLRPARACLTTGRGAPRNAPAKPPEAAAFARLPSHQATWPVAASCL